MDVKRVVFWCLKEKLPNNWEALKAHFLKRNQLEHVLVEDLLDETIWLNLTLERTRVQKATLAVLSLIDELVEKPGHFIVVVDKKMALPGMETVADMGNSARPGMVFAINERIQKRRHKPQQKPDLESPKLSVVERLLRGRENGARAGYHQSGPAPFGYSRSHANRSTLGVRLIIHPEEAAMVRLIFREYLRRRSMKKLIEYLNSKGLRTRRKKQWSRAGVSWILKNETYLGRVHFGNIRAKGVHPALISPIIFNKVQKLIRLNNRRGGVRKVV